jgi:hypothetical protein
MPDVSERHTQELESLVCPEPGSGPPVGCRVHTLDLPDSRVELHRVDWDAARVG